MRPAPRTNRPRIAAWILLALAFVPSAWHAWNARGMPFLGNFNNDDGLYLVGAKSLAEGNSYRILSLPGEPCQTKYPPLYPMLLALVWRWNPHFPENLAALGVLAWLMAPLTVLAASRLYSELGVAPRDRLALCAFLAVHPLVSLLSTHLLAELPFAGLVFAAIALAERAARRPDGYGLAALAGAVAGLAYLTKSAGIVLLVSSPA
ncbi:MAG TPA: hypothetical protein VNJ11_10430, partial [Bryobacteraceae bacterium]|nr:hypothetical protein [Bryobacteraceae bacterium]